MRARVLALTLALSALSTAVAQEEQPAEAAVALPAWAPAWKLGDWWEVRTYHKDMRRELASPSPAEGATPRLPEDPRAAPLPGFPPLRNGIPEGYKEGNRFRLEVVRREEVKYEDDAPGTAPEVFWVVSLRALEGPARAAELWYAAHDLVLSKVVLDPGERAREGWLRGTAQLGVPQSLQLGFPLDWPDLSAAREQRATVQSGPRPFEQRVRVVAAGTPEEEVQVLLQEVERKEQRDVPRVRTLFSFAEGERFWSRILAGNLVAERVASGRKGD